MQQILSQQCLFSLLFCNYVTMLQCMLQCCLLPNTRFHSSYIQIFRFATAIKKMGCERLRYFTQIVDMSIGKKHKSADSYY